MRAEQAAGVEVGEQVLHGEQRVDLLRREPQPGQFVLRTDALTFPLEAIAAEVAIEHDGRVQPVLHVGEVALQRRPRHAELFLQFGARHGRAAGEQLVDAVDALHGAHAVSPYFWRAVARSRELSR